MDTGIGFFATHDAIGPAAIARLVEEHGHAALYFPEHSHIPASRESPFEGGGEMPRKYAHTYDLFVALATAAAATSKLRIGSGICLVTERDPIHTAKAVASVDHLSGGRMDFGVGAGWNREEMANHGTDPGRRFSLLRERVEAMKEIWTSDEAEYHGEHVDFDPIWCWPKPHQSPHPPVLLGGNGDKVLERVVAFADEWMPNPLPGVRERIAELQRLAQEAGRGPIPVTLNAARPDPAALAKGEEAGVHRCLFYLQPGPAEEVERRLDELARLV